MCNIGYFRIFTSPAGGVAKYCGGIVYWEHILVLQIYYTIHRSRLVMTGSRPVGYEIQSNCRTLQVVPFLGDGQLYVQTVTAEAHVALEQYLKSSQSVCISAANRPAVSVEH